MASQTSSEECPNNEKHKLQNLFGSRHIGSQAVHKNIRIEPKVPHELHGWLKNHIPTNIEPKELGYQQIMG